MDQSSFFDSGTWAGIGTVLALLAFVGVCLWAYSGRNKARFDEAARLPFADDSTDTGSASQTPEDTGNKPVNVAETDKVTDL